MVDKTQLLAVRALIVIGVTSALPSSAAATPDLYVYVIETSPRRPVTRASRSRVREAAYETLKIAYRIRNALRVRAMAHPRKS